MILIQNIQHNQTVLWAKMNVLISKTFKNNNGVLLIGPNTFKIKESCSIYLNTQSGNWRPAASWFTVEPILISSHTKLTKNRYVHIREWTNKLDVEEYQRIKRTLGLIIVIDLNLYQQMSNDLQKFEVPLIFISITYNKIYLPSKEVQLNLNYLGNQATNLTNFLVQHVSQLIQTEMHMKFNKNYTEKAVFDSHEYKWKLVMSGISITQRRKFRPTKGNIKHMKFSFKDIQKQKLKQARINQARANLKP